MQYRLRIASYALVLLAAAASAQACGHLPFDALPEIPDGSTSEGGPFADSGGTDGDADADAEDAFVRDGAVPDASCLETGDCGIIYVSSLVGKKGNPGTSDAPVDTIEAGLALATKDRNELHIASGDYSGPVKVTGNDDVRLIGGFKCKPGGCPWTQDNQETIVSAGDLAGGALYIGPGHGRKTIVSRIHFKGAEGAIAADAAGAVTVSVIESTPVLQHLVVDGPLATGGALTNAKRTTGVLIFGKQADPRGVLIDDCTITGGKADAQASGILVEDGPTALGSASPVLDLTASDVTGGLAPTTYAVLLSSAGPNTKIHENKRIQAAAALQHAPTTETWAIAASGNVEISRNVINGSSQGGDYCKNAQTLCGGILLTNANAKVLDNVVHGVNASASAAIALAMSGGHTPTVILNANGLDGAGNGASEGYSAAIFVKNTNQSEGTIGLVRNDILFGGKNKAAYGVAELEGNTVNGHLAAFDHNDIHAETAAYHAWFAGTATAKNYAVTDLATAPVPGSTSTGTTNIGADCLLDATYHLTVHSPCINAGTKQDAPDVDIDGDPRPYPAGNADAFDIGADESKFETP
jgi:hypothetical protein